MDFVHDRVATGRKIRVLAIVSTFKPCALAIEPRFGQRGRPQRPTITGFLEVSHRMAGSAGQLGHVGLLPFHAAGLHIPPG